MRLIISLRENQSATHGMLQKEIINNFRNLPDKIRNVIKDDYRRSLGYLEQ